MTDRGQEVMRDFAARIWGASWFAAVGEPVSGGETFTWGPRDIFVVPSWRRHQHLTESDAVLFSFSDRPVQMKLGLWREDRGKA